MTTCSAYQQFCATLEMKPVQQNLSLANFTTLSGMAAASSEERMTASLQVFMEELAGEENAVEKVDKVLIDSYIARLDAKIASQLNEILHHSEFQRLESSWRGLKYTVSKTDFRSNIKMEILDVDKQRLRMDFEEVPDTTQSGLYKHIYVQEYDTPGGEPISAIISNYEFDASAPDLALLSELSRVAAAAHCPFIGAVGAKFFKKDHIDDVTRIDDLDNYMDKADFIRWRSFRDSEDARYVGLTMPRFLLRLPYGRDNPVQAFGYQEEVAGTEQADKFLWGNASFAFAANMTRSFKKNGWTVNVRGPESGGKVESLPLHQYDLGQGIQTKLPTETLIPETRELEFANLGFIPLSYYKNSDFACFFSANSIQKPALYSTPEATANSRINSRLPYIFLCSRLAHYLKVIQRENIGSNKNRVALENELNDWIQSLVTKMNNPDMQLAATHPLREGRVEVTPIADNPGFYNVNLYVMPHFQVEGVDVRLSLVAQMPTGDGNK